MAKPCFKLIFFRGARCYPPLQLQVEFQQQLRACSELCRFLELGFGFRIVCALLLSVSLSVVGRLFFFGVRVVHGDTY